MGFRRLRSPFAKVEWGGVTFNGTDILLINGLSHYGQIVKVGSRFTKTEYTHVYPDHVLVGVIWEATEPISRREIIKLRHHLTRRIWVNDGVFECINWPELRKEERPLKEKLLPPEMCYRCLLEGNKYIPKQLKSSSFGICRCCCTMKNLVPTRLGWPCDLRHKGFGWTIIGQDRNFTNNIGYYKLHFDMSIYNDYNG